MTANDTKYLIQDKSKYNQTIPMKYQSDSAKVVRKITKGRNIMNEILLNKDADECGFELSAGTDDDGVFRVGLDFYTEDLYPLEYDTIINDRCTLLSLLKAVTQALEALPKE